MFNRLEKIFELTPHPYAVFSADGKLIFQNKVFESLNEIQIKDKNIPRTEFISVLTYLIRGSLTIEPIQIRANQQWFELNFRIDESDKSIIVLGSIISNTVELEKKFRTTENHLDILVNNSEHCLLMEDECRRIAFTNQKFCDLFGIPATPEQMIGADCSQSAEQSKGFFKNPEQFVETINTILHDQVVVQKEILETVDNRILERNYFPIFIDKKYRGHLWTYKDITKERDLKNSIEVQRNFFEQILHGIPADIAVFDANHTYLFINKNGIKNTELREWMIGKRDEDYAALKNKPYEMALLRRGYFNEAMKTKKISSWEDEVKITENESHYILRNFYPMVNDAGEVELVIGYGIDITNRKKVEKQIIANLEKEKQLTESKSNFITTVSHEIRTPLSVISLSAEAMQMYAENVSAPLKIKFEGKLKQIESEIDRLTNIISEVITIEKIESGAFSIQKSPFEFKEFITNLVERQSKIQEDGRVANLQISGKAETINADKMKLGIAIDNLLSNAFKYSPKMPAPKLSVKFNPKNIQIKVTDYGLGIPESYTEKLFKLFERAENVAHIRGTGIGLFIVKQIVELHGGSIQYTANPEGGSIFTVNIPYE